GPNGEAVAAGVISVASRKLPDREIAKSVNPSQSGFLGVGLEQAEGGVKITEVMARQGASKAGVKVDDIITQIDDKKIEDVEAMMDLLQHMKPGDEVTLHIKRGKETKELKATLGKRPADQGDVQNSMGSTLSDR